MNISLGWIKDFVPDIGKVDPKKLASLLTAHVVEVEEVRSSGLDFAHIVIGKILAIEAHPNADRLRVAIVDVGDGTNRTIVCGAPNIAVGQLVPVALPGAVVLNRKHAGEKFTIGKAEVRGVHSEGMLCAPEELGVANPQQVDGVLVLDPAASAGSETVAPGLAFSKLYSPQSDTVLVVENKAIPHRSDLSGHMGMAREIAAVTELSLADRVRKPLSSADLGEAYASAKETELTLAPAPTPLAHRVVAVELDGLVVAPSPDWMQARLQAVGMVPINVVVDITNYVMIETGVPLHAFDASKVEGGLTIRLAKKGENIDLINHKSKKLSEKDIVVADKKASLAIAGIMGGAASEISEGTTQIILEASSFDKVRVRTTSRSLGLSSEASLRHAKGVPAHMVEDAVVRAVQLLQEHAGAKIVGKNDIYVEPKATWDVQFSFAKAQQFLSRGFVLDEAKIIAALETLGFGVATNDHQQTLHVPAWRPDVQSEQDVFEEIARYVGYNTIPKTLPEWPMQAVPEDPALTIETTIRQALVGLGCNEIMTYGFTNDEKYAAVGLDSADLLRVTNPVSPENAKMTGSLVPNMLYAVAKNERFFTNFSLFELAPVYARAKDGVEENRRVIGALVGHANAEPLWKMAKSVVEQMTATMHVGSMQYADGALYSEHTEAYMLPGATAVVLGGHPSTHEPIAVGTVFLVHPKVRKALGIKGSVALFDLDVEALVALQQPRATYTPINTYPSVERDFTFTVDEKTNFADIVEKMHGTSDLIVRVNFLSHYTGEKLGAGKKNISVRAILQAKDHTLTEKEIIEIEQKITKLF